MLYILLLLSALTFSITRCQDTIYSDDDAQILVLGAGRAGLHAATILLDNDITDFIILEGDSEPQGLAKTINFGGLELETGAAWAYPPAKPALDSVNMQYHESDYDSYVVRNDLGEDVTEVFDVIYDKYYQAREVVDGIAQDSLKDKRLDVAQKVGLCVGGWRGYEPIEGAVEWYELDFEYGKSSKDLSIVGPYEQDFGSDSQYYITDRNGGIFGRVLELLDDDHLRLNQIVQEIDQSGERVVVTTEDGTQYIADYVLVTFSIGVLQRNSKLTFIPELPPWKTEQFCRFQRGILDPIFLRFPYKFWENEEWLIHAGNNTGYYPVFLNGVADGLFPFENNLLIAFVTGDEAIRVEKLSDDEVKVEIIQVLKNMYDDAIVPDPVDFYMERWGLNPFHYGTQSTWPIPANVPSDSIRRLHAHVGRIFFANDATHDEFLGTVSASLISSEISTAKIIGCLAGEDCAEYRPKNKDDDEVLYGCVKLEKREGKSRKERLNPVENINDLP